MQHIYIAIPKLSQTTRLTQTDKPPENIKPQQITNVVPSNIDSPTEKSWDSWFDEPGVTDDFMCDREQP